MNCKTTVKRSGTQAAENLQPIEKHGEPWRVRTADKLIKSQR